MLSFKRFLKEQKRVSVWHKGRYIHKDDPDAPTWVRPLSDEEKAHNAEMMKKWIEDASNDPKTVKKKN